MHALPVGVNIALFKLNSGNNCIKRVRLAAQHKGNEHLMGWGSKARTYVIRKISICWITKQQEYHIRQLATQTSSMGITKEEKFVCSYTAIHLDKSCWHVSKLCKVRNQAPYIGFHFLFDPQKSAYVNSISLSELIIQR